MDGWLAGWLDRTLDGAFISFHPTNSAIHPSILLVFPMLLLLLPVTELKSARRTLGANFGDGNISGWRRLKPEELIAAAYSGSSSEVVERAESMRRARQSEV